MYLYNIQWPMERREVLKEVIGSGTGKVTEVIVEGALSVIWRLLRWIHGKLLRWYTETTRL